MNTVDAVLKLKAGEAIPADTSIKVKGYEPCRLATGRPCKRGRVQVVFESGTRRFFPPSMILFGADDIARGYAKA